MSGDYDVVILGGGSAAEMAAEHLVAGGRSVAVVERRLVGGECPFLACMPSKALLHAAAAGMSWPQAVAFRDECADHRDDSRHVKALRDKGVEVVRGEGRITGPGRLRVGDRTLAWRDLIVATGAEPVVPDVPGLADSAYWTSDDALTTTERPDELVVLGGGPIGCELAQAYVRLGCEVTLIEAADRLLPAEPAFVGETVTAALRADGVEVLTAATVDRVDASPGAVVVVALADGERIPGDRLLVAAGKRPRTRGLGLDLVGVDGVPGQALAVDDRGAAAEHVWGAGDVIGLAPYTHAANAQARVVAANILGGDRRFDLHAVPRCVYTDPSVMCVGRTDLQGAPGATGKPGVVTAGFDVGRTARARVDRRRVGRVELFAEAGSGVLVGAAVVAPQADAWGGELVLAIQARIPVRDLVDVVHAFPTYAEALEPAYGELLSSLRG